MPRNGPGLRRLDRSVTGRALLGLLDLAGGDWPRAEVLGWLSAAPLTIGPGGRPVPASRWDVLSAAAGVVSGPGQWRQRLGRLAAAGGADADEAAALAAFMDELIERSRAPGRSWGALAAWAVALLDHYLPPDSDPGRWPVEEEVARRRVRDVVRALADLERLSPGADLPTFRRAVRSELERTSPEPHEPGGGFGDGVFLAPYGTAAGLRMHTVHLTGLADALVPGRGETDGLLGDDVRSRDTSGNLPLRPARREALRRELLAAVATGRHRRVGTLPRGDPRTGRAQVATRWLPDLVGPDCQWRPVDSFSRGLAGAEPALSVQEFELRALDRWVGRGGGPGVGTDRPRRPSAARFRSVGRQGRFPLHPVRRECRSASGLRLRSEHARLGHPLRDLCQVPPAVSLRTRPARLGARSARGAVADRAPDPWHRRPRHSRGLRGREGGRCAALARPAADHRHRLPRRGRGRRNGGQAPPVEDGPAGHHA